MLTRISSINLLTMLFIYLLGIYQENIAVGKIRRKVTDIKILLILPFVFIDFLVVKFNKFILFLYPSIHFFP